MTDLREIYNEWQNNLAFRNAFKKNPEEALKAAGFEVSAEDLVKIKALIKTISEALDGRINK